MFVSQDKVSVIKNNLLKASARCAEFGLGVGASDEQCERLAKLISVNGWLSVDIQRVKNPENEKHLLPVLSACSAMKNLRDSGF